MRQTGMDASRVLYTRHFYGQIPFIMCVCVCARASEQCIVHVRRWTIVALWRVFGPCRTCIVKTIATVATAAAATSSIYEMCQTVIFYGRPFQ